MSFMQNKITIITSLKKTINCRFFYLSKCLLKLMYYSTINRRRKKYCQEKNLLFYLNQSKGKKIIGHEAVLMSIFRGFDKLKQNYIYNPGLKNIKGNVLLCWTKPTDYYDLMRLKDKGKIDKVICVPTVTPEKYGDFIKTIVRDKRINYYLVGSEWAKKEIEKELEEKYHSKIVVWPSGVEFQPKPQKQIKNACLYYCKRKKPDAKVLELLKRLNIKVYVLEYYNYNMKEYIEKLKKVDFAIFLGGSETQGLAYAEAWMQNVPTLVNEYFPKEGEIKDKNCSAPYMNNNGKFYANFEELSSLIQEYKTNPENFLQKFTPYEYASKYMSDSYSAEQLIKLFE